MRKCHHILYQDIISIPHGKNGRNIFAHILDIDYTKGQEQSFVDERDMSYMVYGPIYLSLLALSGADRYLKLSSQYKRSAGRNFGDTRQGTPL